MVRLRTTEYRGKVRPTANAYQMIKLVPYQCVPSSYFWMPYRHPMLVASTCFPVTILEAAI